VRIQTLQSVLSEREKYIPPLISSGVLLKETKAVLYGSFKAGKSTLIAYIAMCLAGGLPLFGSEMFKTVPCRVHYIQLEMPDIPFRRRLRSSTLSQVELVQKNLYLTTEFWLKLDTQEGRDNLISALEEVHPDVLIIDPLYKCTLGGEEYKDLSIVYDHLDKLMHEYHFALIFTAQGRKTLVIQTGKVDLGDQELRGTTATGGWADTILGLRLMEGTNRKLSGTLRHGSEATFSHTISLDTTTGLYSLS